MKQLSRTLCALSFAFSALCLVDGAPAAAATQATLTLPQPAGSQLPSSILGDIDLAVQDAGALWNGVNPVDSSLRWALLPGLDPQGGRTVLAQGGIPGQRVLWTVRLPGTAADFWPIAGGVLDGAGEARVTLPSPSGLNQADWVLWVQVGHTWWPGPQISVGGAAHALGMDATRLEDQAGGMVITEIMKNPSAVSDSAGEWIELFNPIWMRQNIDGWTLSDDGGSATILSNGGMPVWVAGRGHRALVRNLDPTANGGVTSAYAYTSFTLSNGADEVILSRPDGTVVDRVAYDDGDMWPDDAGQSMQLHPGLHSPYSNDSASNWCSSTTMFGAGDMGTPGSANFDC